VKRNQADPATPIAPTLAPVTDGRRRISGRVFRYILLQYWLILACALGGFLALFLVAEAVHDLDDLIEDGASTAQMLLYFWLLLPDAVVQMLPMSLLLAALYCVGALVRNHELTALRSAGVSVPQALAPLLCTGALAVLGHFALAEFAAPWAAQRHLQLERELGRVKREAGTHYLAYHNRRGRRDWFFGRFDPQGASQAVLIAQYRKDGTLAWEIRAASATHRDGEWHLEDAVRSTFDAAGEFEIAPPEHHAELVLALPEKPRQFRFLWELGPVPELSLRRLYQVLHAPEAALPAGTRQTLQTHLWHRLLAPLASLIGVLLGGPLAISEGRGGGMRRVLLAVGLVIAYALGTEFLLLLGRRGELMPLLAGASAPLLFGALGLYLLWRRH